MVKWIFFSIYQTLTMISIQIFPNQFRQLPDQLFISSVVHPYRSGYAQHLHLLINRWERLKIIFSTCVTIGQSEPIFNWNKLSYGNLRFSMHSSSAVDVLRSSIESCLIEQWSSFFREILSVRHLHLFPITCSEERFPCSFYFSSSFIVFPVTHTLM